MVNKKLRRFEEKHALLLVFVVLAVLVLGSLLVMDKAKMTGFAVIQGYNQTECGVANYTWQNITQENCTTEIIYVNETIDCEPCIEYEMINGTQGDCISWSSCVNETSIEEETCIEVIIGSQCVGDICGDGDIQNPNDDGVEEVCDDGDDNGIVCDADYDGSCEYCSDTCEVITVEGSYCEDDNCDAEEDCNSCSSDCGECEEDVTSSDVTGSAVDDTDKTTWGSTCVSNWECGEWSECIGGTQTRECTDTYNCVTPTENLNPMSLSCTEGSETIAEETSETCSDGMMNQDEQGIDCGGVCEQKCSFFTIMGDAVNVPINSSKEFVQNHKAISFSILGVIVLAVSWIVCVKVFLKKKTFFFLNNLGFSKDFPFLKRKKKSDL